MDKAHENADKRLEKMERHLAKIYKEAGADIEKKYADYLKKFSKADEKQRKKLENGEITKADYKKWRKKQMMTGERWGAVRDELARQYTNVNRTALAYINGELPPVYADGYNAIAPSASASMPGYTFALTNADTVKNLATSDKTLLPYKKVNGVKDVRWNTKNVNSAILQGILTGESIPKMAKRLQNVTEMNKNASIRNARTAVTSAENKGRQDSYERLQAEGAIMTRTWHAALQPGRTRDWHLALNGKTAAVDEPFVNDFGEILYPCDPHAHPANIYNCRCVVTAKVTGFKKLPTIGKSGKVLTSRTNDGIIETGSRIIDLYSEKAIAHAELYYEEIRHFTEDIAKIAKNTEKSENEIAKIKAYLFEDNSFYDEDLNEWRRFDPDCAIAHSWQRLIQGKNIQKHDITLINHELYELEIKSQHPEYSHAKAHLITTQRYNYQKEVEEYYANLKKNKQKR